MNYNTTGSTAKLPVGIKVEFEPGSNSILAPPRPPPQPRPIPSPQPAQEETIGASSKLTSAKPSLIVRVKPLFTGRNIIIIMAVVMSLVWSVQQSKTSQKIVENGTHISRVETRVDGLNSRLDRLDNMVRVEMPTAYSDEIDRRAESWQAVITTEVTGSLEVGDARISGIELAVMALDDRLAGMLSRMDSLNPPATPE